jgi:adenylosuccinate synthase
LIDVPPLRVDHYADVEPVYEEHPGWHESTVGVTQYDALPEAARNYLDRMQTVLNAPVDLISTGPDRDQTIVLKHPYS